ncbi:MAG: hypothetical protein Q3977_00700 [Oscillospiraceae bacterium]|nr:hypothetical protein [Oscillospiraceae bacterium]
MKKRFWCLLLAALLVLSLAACGEKSAVPQTLESGGVTLPIPEEYKDLLVVETRQDDPQGYLFLVFEKASVEAGKKLNGSENGYDGWLFSIGRVSEEAAQEMRCGDHSGAEFFAKTEDGTHYVFYHPTDVTLVREDMSAMTDADQKQWTELNEWAWSGVRDAFLAENAGLEAVSFGNTDLDIALARIAFLDDVNYTISTTEYGPLEPNGVDPAPYLDRLMNGVAYEYTDEAAPDGEYVVLGFPDEDVRYDFFLAEGKENYVRRASSDYEVLFRATFADGETKASEVMQEWYDALAAQRDIDLLGYTPDSFLGRWAEKIAGRGLITIEKGEAEDEYAVRIEWSSSAAEQAIWEMTAKPEASNALRYENARHLIRTYSSEAAFTDEVKYENGTGTFTLNSANEVMWQDEIDHAGDNTVFISAG